MHSTLAKPFFRAHRDRKSVAEEEACAYSVNRFFLMIPCRLPQATIKELLRHNTQFVRHGARLFDQSSRLDEFRSIPVKAFSTPIKIRAGPFRALEPAHGLAMARQNETARGGRCSKPLEEYSIGWSVNERSARRSEARMSDELKDAERAVTQTITASGRRHRSRPEAWKPS